MIIQDDVIHWAETYGGELFHAMLCDPPYHLVPQFKRWGNATSLGKTKDVFARQARGMMGQKWDGGDLAFRPETWAALAQHLYPGAFIMAFASSRGWHRMAVAMEDAGLILHPSLFMFGWCYLSGFPKATNISSQIDKASGYESIEGAPLIAPAGNKGRTLALNGGWQSDPHEKLPATPLAQAWSSHRYGGQMIKPAIEPIIVAQVPYQGRPVDNIVETGAGALWIDGSRIEAEKPTGWAVQPSRGYSGGLDSIEPNGRPTNGRWPSNLILHCSCSPTRPDKGIHDESCAVAVLDGQSGEHPAEDSRTGNEPSSGKAVNCYQDGLTTATFNTYADSGPASRMFYTSDWAYEVAEQLAAADSIRYEPKANSTEREIGLDNLETQTRHRVNAGGLENEPRFAPIQVKNDHPCQKPVSLTKYLATLLAPPKEYAPRRLLIPFCGAGSEVIGAILSQQWEEIVGIEMSEHYCDLARARAAWWSQWPGWGQTDVDKILASDEEEKQLRMF